MLGGSALPPHGFDGLIMLLTPLASLVLHPPRQPTSMPRPHAHRRDLPTHHRLFVREFLEEAQ
eukprot:7688020-Alexandrium_andersonii.AAC.1